MIGMHYSNERKPMNWKAKLAALGLAACIPLVGFYEGLKVKTYLDPVGIATVCYGHTGKDVKLGQTYTLAQCDEILAQDLLKANAIVNSCVTGPLTPNQRTAFVSFAFNVGPGTTGVKDGFCRLKSGRPSSILNAINSGNARHGCDLLLAWDKAGGKTLAGLTKRRQAERAICLKG